MHFFVKIHILDCFNLFYDTFKIFSWFINVNAGYYCMYSSGVIVPDDNKCFIVSFIGL